jgi:hypothetical protein
MSLRQRIGGQVMLFSQAVSRVRAEFDDLTAEQHGEQRTFDALVYVRHMSPAEVQRFKAAIFACLGMEPTEAKLTVGLRRGSIAWYVQADAPHAEAAAMRVLTVVRDALHDAELTTDMVRLEVELGDSGVAPVEKGGRDGD